MFTIRRAHDRGRAQHGWLESWHTFSFGDYADPAHAGFSVLRVLNEDIVQPARGFDLHPHSDMEILTWILEGALEHKDSLGHGSVIRPDELQYMSAGKGLSHSEFNHSKSERVHLLQIWILPNEKKATPRYSQKKFSGGLKPGGLCLLVSPDGSQGSIAIRQDVRILGARTTMDREFACPLGAKRNAWLQVARGSVRLNGEALGQGDGAAIEKEKGVAIQASKGSEFLFFDLP